MTKKLLLILSSTLMLGGCDVPDNETASAETNAETVTQTTAIPVTPATGELGSGIYATECDGASNEYAIRLIKGDDGFTNAEVDSGGKTYADLLTSYSYMGDATPHDFHIAVMFDGENSPVPVPADGDSRIELWKGEAAYYALINGDEALRLFFCR